MVTKYQKRISGPLLDRIDIPSMCRALFNEKRSTCPLDETGKILLRSAMSQCANRAGSEAIRPKVCFDV